MLAEFHAAKATTNAPRYQRVARAKSIIGIVAAERGLTVTEILGEARDRHVVSARHEAIYRVVSECGLGCSITARIFGRDHSTIIHALRKYRKRQAEQAA